VQAGQHGSAFVTVADVELADFSCIQLETPSGRRQLRALQVARATNSLKPFRRRDESGSKRVALPSADPRAHAIDLGPSNLNASSRFERVFADGA
jgi:hypothetical protein